MSRFLLLLRGLLLKEASGQTQKTMLENIRCPVLTVALVLGTTAGAFAQTFQVRIVDRHEIKTELSAAIPDSSDQSKGDKSTTAKDGKTTALDKSGTTGDKTAKTLSYTVTGATLTLELPDSRLVRVTCESKYALRFDYINRRSCRTPPADDVTAEFKGDEAKLIWSISLDDRKTQSETYTILNIVPRRR
jgi:hypothetical protein